MYMDNRNEYDQLNAQKQNFVYILEQLRSIAVSSGNPPWCNKIESMLARIRTDCFRVLVVGQFKRGKSTFINAMLGKKILPATAIPCTATIHQLKYGPEPRAFIYRVSVNGGNPSEAEEIDIGLVSGSGFSSGVGEQGLGTIQPGQGDAACEYEKIEICWPLDLLKNGVEIIDSPGLNESGTREKTTMDFVPKADAIIFVMACDQLGTRTEMDFIKNVLKPMGHEDIFFICNRIDQIQENQRDELVDWAHERLDALVTSSDQRIFFTNSAGALMGREKGEETLIESSGIKAFEKAIAEFLARQKGQAKLRALSVGIRELVRKFRRKVMEMEAMANTSKEDLIQRVQRAKEPYDILKRRREQINRRMAETRSDFQQEVYLTAKSFWNELTPQIENWTQEIDPGTIKIEHAASIIWVNSLESLRKRALNALGATSESLAVPSEQPEDPIEQFIKETIKQLKRKITQHHTEWLTEQLEPLISRKIRMLKNCLVDDLINFEESVQRLRAEISGITVESNKAADDWMKNLEELLPRIQRDISGLAIIEAINILNPWVLIRSILQGDVLNLWRSIGRNLSEAIKSKVTAEIKNHLDLSATKNSQNLADNMTEKMEALERNVDDILKGELEDISHQVKRVALLKQQGEKDFENELSICKSISAQLDTIDRALDDEVLKLLPTYSETAKSSSEAESNEADDEKLNSLPIDSGPMVASSQRMPKEAKDRVKKDYNKRGPTPTRDTI
jgi:predicted GTPase